MRLKVIDRISRHYEEKKSEKELKHFQESAACFYKNAQELYREDVQRRKNK